MAPTAEEAAAALREVQSIRTRSMQLRSYQYAAPQLILWGCFGFLATALALSRLAMLITCG